MLLSFLLEQEALSVPLPHHYLPLRSGRNSLQNFQYPSTLMASIPLLCNICPKHPDFSDISHLLTHVGSKGHLSHYFKAQVRSRQEPAVRQRLDTYDRWYAKYQIEKLLSQRMVLKESKEVKATWKANKMAAPAPLSTSVTSKRATRAGTRPQRPVDDDTPVGAIDPQLSRDPLLSSESCAHPTPDPPTGELASRHRAYIPQMRQRDSVSRSRTHSLDPGAKEPLQHRTQKKRGGIDNGGDLHERHEHSPVEMAYPDPSTLSDASHLRVFQPSSAGSERNLQYTAPAGEAGRYTPTIDEAEPVQSPVLKGIQWPGMNIFDSASPEAQRKRNQKKTNSIMVQMELNSSAVEPLERIFWPEGDLKKERVITGMVESSPMKEESPRPRRRRHAPSRTVLGDLSTNHQNRGRRSTATKSSSKTIESRDADLGDLSKRTIAMLDPVSYEDSLPRISGSGIIDGEDIEWRLNAGNPLEQGDDFIIYHDEDESEPDRSLQVTNSVANPMDHSSIACHLGTKDGELSFFNQDFTFTPSPPGNIQAPRTNRHLPTNVQPPGDHHASLEHPSRKLTSEKENLEPHLHHRVPDDAWEFRPERTTQRYFCVNKGYPPEFFDFLPPQMEFGGLDHANPHLFGTSRNPLLPREQRRQGPNLRSGNDGAMQKHK